MTRPRRRVRTVVVDSVPFVWNVAHKRHVLPRSPPGANRCREVFSAYLKGVRTRPLRVWFTASEGRGAGYPAAGVAWVCEGARLFIRDLLAQAIPGELVRRASPPFCEPVPPRHVPNSEVAPSHEACAVLQLELLDGGRTDPCDLRDVVVHLHS